MDITFGESSGQTTVIIDNLYNLLVCKECGIGLPFQWVVNDLRDQHGLKMDGEVINGVRLTIAAWRDRDGMR
jgi:hypothetical protein